MLLWVTRIADTKVNLHKFYRQTSTTLQELYAYQVIFVSWTHKCSFPFRKKKGFFPSVWGGQVGRLPGSLKHLSYRNAIHFCALNQSIHSVSAGYTISERGSTRKKVKIKKSRTRGLQKLAPPGECAFLNSLHYVVKCSHGTGLSCCNSFIRLC